MRLIFGSSTALFSITFMLAGCGSNQGNSSPDAQVATSHWAGHTYLLDIPAKNWRKPSTDVGGEIAPFVPQFLIAVTGTSNNLTATIATAENGAQDTCNQTQQVTFDESQYPASDFALSRFPMYFHEVNDYVTPSVPITVKSTIHDMTFSSLLPGDSSSSATGSFTVTADLVELAPLFIKPEVPQPATGDGVCGTIKANSTATCATCAFDSNNNDCLTLGAVQLTATLTTATVTQVSLADIPASCASNH